MNNKSKYRINWNKVLHNTTIEFKCQRCNGKQPYGLNNAITNYKCSTCGYMNRNKSIKVG